MSNRIPPDFIEDVLLRTDIVELARNWANLSLKKQGANYTALCPFHQEKSPSFNINPTKQIFHCFGCQKSGDAIAFVREFGHLDFKDAVTLLAQQLGLNVPEENSENTQQQLARKKDLEWLNRVHQFYIKLLWQSQEGQAALTYLRDRGLSDETIRQFGLGYAPRNIRVLLDALKQQPNSQEILKSLERSGILIFKNQKIRSYFFERILFPIHNRRGEIIAFGGRTIHKDHNPKYLNSPDNSLFHKGFELYNQHSARKFIRPNQPLWVVEGYMDVIAMAQAGIPTAVATLGTAATIHHLKLLLKLAEETSLIFCFDGDQAGQKASARVLNLLLPLLQDGSLVAFILLPSGEDPDSYIKKYGSQAFQHLKNEAIPISQYLFKYLKQSYNLDLVEDRTRFLVQARKLIQQIQAPIFKKFMQQQLQELFTGPTPSSDTNRPAYSSSTSLKYIRVPKVKSLNPCARAILLILHDPKIIHFIPEHHNVPESLISISPWSLWHSVLTWLRSHPNESLNSATPFWPNKQEAKELKLLERREWPEERLNVSEEFQSAIQAIETSFIKAEANLLLEKSKKSSLTDEERLRLKELQAFKIQYNKQL